MICANCFHCQIIPNYFEHIINRTQKTGQGIKKHRFRFKFWFPQVLMDKLEMSQRQIHVCHHKQTTTCVVYNPLVYSGLSAVLLVDVSRGCKVTFSSFST